MASLEQADRYEGDPWEEVIPVGRKTVAALLSARCFLVASTSRRHYGHRSTRTVWLAVSEPLVGSVIASAREPDWSGAIEGWSNKCSHCCQFCSRSVPSSNAANKACSQCSTI
jgi:hypothetical protein